MKRSLTAALAAALLFVGASPAYAGPRPIGVQEQIDAALREFPGGRQISANAVSWDGGAVVLTIAAPGALAPMAVGSCATGTYCAYNGVSLTGSKLAFTACSTTVSLAALPGLVRSIANGRTSGTVAGRTAGGTTLTTVAAGSQVNSAPAGVTHLRCTA